MSNNSSVAHSVSDFKKNVKKEKFFFWKTPKKMDLNVELGV